MLSAPGRISQIEQGKISGQEIYFDDGDIAAIA